MAKFLANNTNVDINDLFDNMINLINDIYGIINLFKKDLGNNKKLNQLGLNLNITSASVGLDPVSLQTDALIGLQYLVLNSLRIHPNLIRTTQKFFKSFLFNALFSTNSDTPDEIKSGVITMTTILNGTNGQHQNNQKTGAYNPLMYLDYHEVPSEGVMPLSKDLSTISVADFNTLIKKHMTVILILLMLSLIIMKF